MILGELIAVAEGLEDPASFEKMSSEFAQKIDRIMGGAKTLHMMDPDHDGLAAISKLAEQCKSIGYKAALKKEAALISTVSGFFLDVLEVIQGLLRTLENKEESRRLAEGFFQTLEKRLAWLQAKLEV